MDATHFDRLVSFWSNSGSRRSLVALVATLPLLGGLVGLPGVDDDVAGKGRRKRRKKRHKHGKGRHKGRNTGQCKAHSRDRTCAGTCGAVKNNCRKTVDCGPCACDPACGVCETCTADRVCERCSTCCNDVCCPQADAVCDASTGACCLPDSRAQTCDGQCGEVLNICGIIEDCGPCACGGPCPACQTCDETTGDCIADPGDDGQPCGDATCAGGVFTTAPTCNGSGVCQPGSSASCAPYAMCDGNACAQTCTGGGDCVSGAVCCGGSCEVGVCCDSNACASEGAPDCVDYECVCAANNDQPCGGEACCATGCVDLDDDPDNCGACGVACPPGQVCQGRQCGFECDGDLCDPTSEICVNGDCQACTVTCNAADHTCSGTELQAALTAGGTVYVCPGIYTGGFSLTSDVTVIGAGQGDDERSATIFDGQSASRVVSVSGSSTVSLAQLRITRGAFTGLGAGVFINGGDLTMRACTVTGNTATNGRGGGLNIGNGSSLTMIACTVSNNTTTGASGSRHGAGIANTFGGTVSLANCTISGNTSAQSGGGIQNDGTIGLDGCTLGENRANGGDGGGIRNSGGTVTLTDGSVNDNVASGAGGGLFTSSGTVTITDTSFQNNNPNNCAGSGMISGPCG